MKTIKILSVILCLFASTLAMQAQNNAATRVAEIRKMYADAKDRISKNGKGGNPALDMRVCFSDVVLEEEGYTEENEKTYYFDQVREFKDGQFYETNVPYFLIQNWSACGHTSYTEMLLNPKNGQLIFYFNRSETHAGLVTEARYYFDDNGRLVELKRKNGDEKRLSDVTPEPDDDGSPQLKQANCDLNLFKLLMNQKEVAATGNNTTTTTLKTERLKSIRNEYAKAKTKTEANAKTDMPRDITVVIHDQEEGDCPPTTFTLNYWFDEVKRGEETNNRCYFISSRYSFMGFNNYNEYLTDIDSQRLMFSYTQVQEENQKLEWRYYFDENGKCIETKTNAEEQDNGEADQQTFRRYMKIFNMVANGEE